MAPRKETLIISNLRKGLETIPVRLFVGHQVTLQVKAAFLKQQISICADTGSQKQFSSVRIAVLVERAPQHELHKLQICSLKKICLIFGMCEDVEKTQTDNALAVFSFPNCISGYSTTSRPVSVLPSKVTNQFCLSLLATFLSKLHSLTFPD